MSDNKRSGRDGHRLFFFLFVFFARLHHFMFFLNFFSTAGITEWLVSVSFSLCKLLAVLTLKKSQEEISILIWFTLTFHIGEE